RPRRGAGRLAVVVGDDESADAQAQLHLCAAGGEVPQGITTVVDFADPSRARLRTGADVEDIVVECLSRPQAAAIAESSAEREGEVAQLPDAVALSELGVAGGSASVLSAAVGRTESAEVALDLAEDGPHAIVTGMTGSGKSELLVTWIVAMVLAHSPEEVAFVVDDSAALGSERADLAVVFTDIAAGARALGMHLILGTQRVGGVIRDALAANCPLRVSLRVTDAADSRLVIGSDDAAELPGGAQSRGLAFVRRPQDATAIAVRVALTGAADLRGIGARWPDAAAP